MSLGGPCLSSCSQHWAGSGVCSILNPAVGLLAVGLEGGGALLFSERDLGAPVSEVPSDGLPCTAGACSPDGSLILLGHGSRLQWVALGEDPPPALKPLDLQGGQPDAAIACITCQERAAIFAVAKGSWVHILDAAGHEKRRIGPLLQPVTQLAWAGDMLIGATPAALYTWTHSAAEDGPVLPSPSPDSCFMRIAPSPQCSYLAASCGGKEVLCWQLPALLGMDAPDQPFRLQDFDAPVDCLAWDPSGRYLATTDGADCTVWDLSDLSGANRSSSIVCCGHEPRTTITAMAFQPDGPLLATASSSGKVALFDCRQFRRGGVLVPAAFTRLDLAPDPVTALLWLPEGRLAVGDAAGRLACVQLMDPAPASGELSLQQSPAQQQALAKLHQQRVAEEELAGSLARLDVGTADQAASATSPQRPYAGANGSMADAAAAVAAATAAAAAALSPLDGRLPNGHASVHQPASDRQDTSVIAPGSHSHEGGSNGVRLSHDGGSNGVSHSRQNSASSGGAGVQQRRARGGSRGVAGRGHGAAASTPGANGEGLPSGTAAGPAGFSPALMHHIQAIRENPPLPGAPRTSDQQPQLAGWGLGSPSGAQVPWMMAGAVSGASPATNAAAFSQMQAQSAAMMQRHMAAMQQAPVGMAAAFMGTPPASPQTVAAAGGYPPSPMYAPAAGAMGAQQMMAAQWMPYMQQVQQWAGTAPGYMMYQHPQYAVAAASMQSAALRNSQQHGGGGLPGMVPPFGASAGMAVRAATSTASGRLSPIDTVAVSPKSAAGPASAFGAAYHRMDSGGSAAGERQANVQASLEAAEVAEAADRSNNRDNNRAGSPRSRGSRRGSAAAIRGPAAREAHSRGSPRSGQPHPLHQAGAAGGSHARGQQHEAQEGGSSVRQGQGMPPDGQPNGTSGSANGSQPSNGSGSGSGSDAKLHTSTSLDLNNADMNDRALSGSSDETGSQPELGPSASGSGEVCTVYVGNLPGTVDEYTLMCAFAPFGPITHVQVIKEKGSNLSRGYGFVSFAHPIYATVAMQHMNQQVLFGPFAGQRIKVAPSKRT